jgi:hypothetical protein
MQGKQLEHSPSVKSVANFLKGKLSYLSKSGEYVRHASSADSHTIDLDNQSADNELILKDFLILLCKSLHV